MLKLYADYPIIVQKQKQFLRAANQKQLFVNENDFKQRLNYPVEIDTVRDNLLLNFLYVKSQCEKLGNPKWLGALCAQAQWDENLFEWLEIDTKTYEIIEPKTKQEQILHGLRATAGNNVFHSLRNHEKTQHTCEVYLYQSHGFPEQNLSKVTDEYGLCVILPYSRITPQMVRYACKYFNREVSSKLLYQYIRKNPLEALHLVPYADSVCEYIQRHYDHNTNQFRIRTEGN